MIAEGIQKLRDILEDANAFHCMELPGNRVIVGRGSKTPEVFDKDRRNLDYAVASFASFNDWVARYKTPKTTIEVDEDVVIAFADPESHIRDSVRWSLDISKARGSLQRWMERPKTPKEVVRALRSTLFGLCDEKHLPVFRNLDFERVQQRREKLSHASESLGRSVEVAAQSTAGEIPEVIKFTVPWWDNVPIGLYNCKFAIEVDADNSTIGILPVGGCLEECRQRASLDLVESLKKQHPDVLVLY